MDPTKGLFRRRPSNASTHSRLRAQSSNANASSSSLSVTSVAAQSCPTSPKTSPLPMARRSVGNERIPEDEIVLEQPPTTSREAAEYAAAFEDARREQEQRQQQLGRSQRSPRPGNSSARETPRLGNSSSSSSRETPRVSSAGSRRESTAREGNGSAQLQRSASTVSGFGVRPRSSPAGLHAYTGSVPSSVHGSRVDLRDADKGSAIYLGCSAPRASTLSISSSRGSSGGSAPPSPCHTPPASPRHGVKRSTSLVKKPR
ncbi:uncharacterized protein [Drosophila takahashii]